MTIGCPLRLVIIEGVCNCNDMKITPRMVHYDINSFLFLFVFRTAAIEALNATGQDQINTDALYKVISGFHCFHLLYIKSDLTCIS